MRNPNHLSMDRRAVAKVLHSVMEIRMKDILADHLAKAGISIVHQSDYVERLWRAGITREKYFNRQYIRNEEALENIGIFAPLDRNRIIIYLWRDTAEYGPLVQAF